jgi:hypothetical protein
MGRKRKIIVEICFSSALHPFTVESNFSHDIAIFNFLFFQIRKKNNKHTQEQREKERKKKNNDKFIIFVLGIYK